MQVKKAELRQNIYDVACQMMLKKGYEMTSLRMIAKKANTSIGNFYHYYKSKEELMDEMMQHAYQLIDHLMIQHFSQNIQLDSADDLQLYWTNDDWWEESFGALLCPEVAIYIRQELPPYQNQKETFLKQMRVHLAHHMCIKNEDDYIVKIVCNMFLDGFIFIVKSNLKKEQAIREFIRLFRSICNVILPPIK